MLHRVPHLVRQSQVCSKYRWQPHPLRSHKTLVFLKNSLLRKLDELVSYAIDMSHQSKNDCRGIYESSYEKTLHAYERTNETISCVYSGN